MATGWKRFASSADAYFEPLVIPPLLVSRFWLSPMVLPWPLPPPRSTGPGPLVPGLGSLPFIGAFSWGPQAAATSATKTMNALAGVMSCGLQGMFPG